MVLNKRIKRSFKNNFSFYLCSIILTMLTSAFMIACISTGNTLKSGVNRFMEDNAVENAEFNTYLDIDEESVSELEKEYNVLIEKNRCKDIKYGDSTIRTFVQTVKVNKYEVVEGSDISTDSDILITKRYADENGISIGDKLELGGSTFTITGFAAKADYLYMIESFSDVYRNNSTFALAIVTDSAFEKLSGDESDYYGIIYNGSNELDVRKKINDDYKFMRYLSEDANTRISIVKNEGDSVNFMAKGGCPVLFLIVVAIIAMVLSRMIKKETVIFIRLLRARWDMLFLVQLVLRVSIKEKPLQ